MFQAAPVIYSLFNTKANVKAVIPLPPDLAAIKAEYFASAAEAQGEGGVSND